ncbi:hypothetical protein [Janthinobacterium sp.]|uniref:hypothetical protein n=1 Tax=Janthinobacterium sp. TaxID=1871054 RepID=UPI0025859FFB|nr:hypothetical protein [Janthinobacterium sp.]MCX7294509.1 hypothetical protein [Janthinobacterium sp.]
MISAADAAHAAAVQAIADQTDAVALTQAADAAAAAAAAAAHTADLTDANALHLAADAAAAAALQAQAQADLTDAGSLTVAANAAAAAAAAAQAHADLTDASQLFVLSQNALHSPLTVADFSTGLPAAGGDVIDMSAIAHLTASVAVGVNLSTDFGADNLFIFDGTSVSIGAAASAIAADNSVLSGQGYIVIADAQNNGAVTVYHSSDLSNANAIDTALVLLSGVNITQLTAANFHV